MPSHDDVARYRKTLPCPDPDLLGRKEWLEYLLAYFFRNSPAIIRDRHADFTVARTCYYFDSSALTSMSVTNGVGRINDEIEKHLRNFSWKAERGWQLRSQIERDLRRVFPFVTAHGERRFDDLVEIDRLFLKRYWVREFAHRANDSRDLGDALLRFLQSRRTFGEKKFQVRFACMFSRFDKSNCLFR